MRIHILCVSKRPRDWVTAATHDYLKRLKGQFEIVVHEVAPVKQPAKNSQLEKEAERLRHICPSRAFQIALDERGESWSTMDLADKLDRWRAEHADIAFYIGGADGLDARIVADADCRWSLSRLTLPHQLVRVVLIEQLYRGWTVLQNHPYHRA
jgi:23S rRNA (pseudouridine1915-N3)-methyltransferase